jgi:hypothetical protein
MGKRVAVLISGGFADKDGYDEFWNDLVRMWRVLMDSGYKDENIILLYGNGTDYEDPGRPFYSFKRQRLLAHSKRVQLTNFSADCHSVEYVFNTLAGQVPQLVELPERLIVEAAGRIKQPKAYKIQKLTKSDSLFIWTFDHGRRINGESYLGLINGQSIIDKDFARLVDKVACNYRVICMQQCFSGGFIDNLAKSRNLVLTACSSDETANRSDTENETVDEVTYHHGEFNYNLFTALSVPRIKNIADLTGDMVDEFEKMRKLFSFVFKYICNNGTRPETTQYFDGSGVRSEDSSSVSSESAKQSDFLKASWTLGNDGGNISLEFTYDIKNVGASLSSQRVKTEAKMNGLVCGTFEFTADGQSFLIDLDANENHYGMFGYVTSNYTDKTIAFNGSIIARPDAYCASQSYSADGTAINAADYSCIVFKWI